MSPRDDDGIFGLEGIRSELRDQGRLQAEDHALLYRIDERTIGQGREIGELKVAVHDVDAKQDAILDELAQSRGVTVEKASNKKGAVSLGALIVGASGLLVALAQLFMR